MELQLEKLELAYDYLQLKLAEIRKHELLVIESYRKGLIVMKQTCRSSNDSRIFPTTPFEFFKSYVRMKHYQLDINLKEGHSNEYFYVSRVKD